MEPLSPDLSTFHQMQAEVDNASLNFQEWLDLQQPPSDPFSDALDSFLFTEPEARPPPTHFASHSDPSVLSLPPDLYPHEFNNDFCPFPKRARSYDDIYFHSNSMFNCNYFDGPLIGKAGTNCSVPEFVFYPSTMELPVLPVEEFSTGCCEKKTGGSGCLSTQSVAARERRKRIGEKTQELGKLIPGGNKMNTAEMFQAAYRYVKFLQAQVRVLGLLGSMAPDQGLPNAMGEQLQVLLGSLAIQEKLYHEEKCMVPKDLVEALTKDQEIKSKASISRDLTGSSNHWVDDH